MAETTRARDIPAAPPDAPTPPAGDAESTRTDAEQRHHRISEAAYYRAERRGFTPGSDQEDWFEAEREVDRGKPFPGKPEANDFPTPK